MAVMARAQQRQLAARHVLFVVCEGMPRRVLSGPQGATFGEGCLALRCEGGELTASVDLQRHDVDPVMPGSPWRVAAQESKLILVQGDLCKTPAHPRDEPAHAHRPR